MTMTTEEIFAEIYKQIDEVKSQGRLPYYLFLSKSNFNIIKEELTVKKPDLIKEGKFDFFENMEVVPFIDGAVEYIEVKGILDKRC